MSLLRSSSLALALAVCALSPSESQAYSSGIGSVTSSGCNTCHSGGTAPSVTLTPAGMTVAPGATIPVTLTLTTPNGTSGGFYITTGGVGTFTARGGSRGITGNATHNAPQLEDASG